MPRKQTKKACSHEDPTEIVENFIDFYANIGEYTYQEMSVCTKVPSGVKETMEKKANSTHTTFLTG